MLLIFFSNLHFTNLLIVFFSSFHPNLPSYHPFILIYFRIYPFIITITTYVSLFLIPKLIRNSISKSFIIIPLPKGTKYQIYILKYLNLKI